MATPPPDWKEQATRRYRERLEKLHEQLGDHASIIEIEALLIEHEHDLMSDTLDALTQGVPPPRDNQEDT